MIFKLKFNWPNGVLAPSSNVNGEWEESSLAMKLQRNDDLGFNKNFRNEVEKTGEKQRYEKDELCFHLPK